MAPHPKRFTVHLQLRKGCQHLTGTRPHPKCKQQGFADLQLLSFAASRCCQDALVCKTGWGLAVVSAGGTSWVYVCMPCLCMCAICSRHQMVAYAISESDALPDHSHFSNVPCVLGCASQHHSCMRCVRKPVYRDVQQWVLQCINTVCTELLGSDWVGLLPLAGSRDVAEVSAVCSCLEM